MSVTATAISRQTLKFTPHVFRIDATDDQMMPVKSPKNRAYFIVSGFPHEKNRKYLYRLVRDKEGMLLPDGVKWAPFKSRDTLAFDSLAIAEGFVEMLHSRTQEDPNAREIFLVLEAVA